MLWRMVRAKLAARAGDTGTAERLVEEALVLAREADSPALEAGVRMAAADVQLVLGRPDMAEPPLREALRLSIEKGDVVSARRAETRLAAIAAGGSPQP